MFNENRKIKIDIQYKKQHISYIIIFDLYFLKTSCIIIPAQSSVSVHCFVDHRLYFFFLPLCFQYFFDLQLLIASSVSCKIYYYRHLMYMLIRPQ